MVHGSRFGLWAACVALAGWLHGAPAYADDAQIVYDASAPTVVFAVQELEGALRARGYLEDESLLKISDRAHLIMPYHRAIDQARERLRGEGRIGTTGRGIGPTYEDKMARIGLRFAELVDAQLFADSLRATIEEKNTYLRTILGEQALDYNHILDQYARLRERLAPLVIDASLYLERALAAGRRVLFEGAQGTMLDVDFGTYPFVTSSNPIAGAACVGSGVGPGAIDEVLGVVKAYTTRVGDGPFPTELKDAMGGKLRERGAEFGATTGRPRRCGWFDAVVVRHAVRINGLTRLALTKLDVLSSWERVPVCVAYDVDGVRHDEMPMTQSEFGRAKPIYEFLDGWWEDISGCRSFADLPVNAQRYVEALEEMSGTRIWGVGVGPGREQTLVVHET